MIQFRSIRHLYVGLLLSALAAKPVLARPNGDALHLVERTLSGLGAGRDIATVTSIEIEAREILQDLVENDHPLTAPFNLSSINTIRRQDDLARSVQRTTIEAPGGGAVNLVSNTLVVSTTPDIKGAFRRVGAAAPEWALRNPIAALRRAQRAIDLRLEADVSWHGATQHVVSFHDEGYPVRIYVGAETGLPSATEALLTYQDQHGADSIAWNALGDVAERTEYMNWSVADGIRYPLQQDTLRDGRLMRTVLISSVKLNMPVDVTDLALRSGEAFAPASVQDLRPDQKVPGPYPDKPIAEIAPGIVQIPNSWYSAIVRQTDGLVIIDAPISAGYAKGVLAEAAKRYPGVPVKALITSTGFFWHVAGVREFAARGIPIYAEARNAPVIARMLAAPHTLAPDKLSARPHLRPFIIPVSRRTVIGKGANAIELYPVAQATTPMLMSYVRDSRLLHTGEMVQPLGPGGSILFPESVIELLHTVRADGLSVDRMVGMHMSPTPWSALEAMLKNAKASS